MVFCFCYCLGIKRLISKFIIVNDFVIVYILFFGCFYNILMKNSQIIGNYRFLVNFVKLIGRLYIKL